MPGHAVAIDDADEVSFLLKRDKRLLEVDWPKGVHDMLGPLSLATRTGPSHEGARAVVMQVRCHLLYSLVLPCPSCLVLSGLVVSGLVWSGLVWSGLVSPCLVLSAAAHLMSG